jgi:hypothetical protein
MLHVSHNHPPSFCHQGLTPAIGEKLFKILATQISASPYIRELMLVSSRNVETTLAQRIEVTGHSLAEWAFCRMGEISGIIQKLGIYGFDLPANVCREFSDIARQAEITGSSQSGIGCGTLATATDGIRH